MITLIRALREIGGIDPHTSALLEELRQLGNSAILDLSPTNSLSLMRQSIVICLLKPSSG